MTRRRHDPDAADQLISFASTESFDSGMSSEVSPTLRVGSGEGIPSPPAVQRNAMVRRLTPTECERLQGMPDGWTLLEESDDPNPPPDSPRYAACGDAVTVNVAEWIGRRLLPHSKQRPSK